jgi:AcrR family transcriptional regulator
VRPSPPQQQRLLAAMADVVSQDGYARVSVARVCELAGVSRATFYQHFQDREDCFLALYRNRAEQMGERIAEALAPGDPKSALEVFLRAIAEDPAGAKVLFVEAFGAGPAVRTEQETMTIRAEAALERYLARTSLEGLALQLPATALLGGVGAIVTQRIFEDRSSALLAEIEDLSAWITSHAIDSSEERLDEVDWQEIALRPPPTEGTRSALALLPRGLNAPTLSETARSHRERILVATARLAAEKGYEDLTVADITAAARVSRGAFYRQFRGKEDAYLAAQGAARRGSMAAAASEFFTVSGWPERVWTAGAAMLSYVASHPDLARMEMLETPVVGKEAMRLSYETRMAYSLFLEDGYRQRESAESLPRLCSEAIAGAIFAVMRRQAVRERTAEMLEVLPICTYLALAPFIGPVGALNYVRSCRDAFRDAI